MFSLSWFRFAVGTFKRFHSIYCFFLFSYLQCSIKSILDQGCSRLFIWLVGWLSPMIVSAHFKLGYQLEVQLIYVLCYHYISIDFIRMKINKVFHDKNRLQCWQRIHIFSFFIAIPSSCWKRHQNIVHFEYLYYFQHLLNAFPTGTIFRSHFQWSSLRAIFKQFRWKVVRFNFHE